jgi:hypothetical protein
MIKECDENISPITFTYNTFKKSRDLYFSIMKVVNNQEIPAKTSILLFNASP